MQSLAIEPVHVTMLLAGVSNLAIACAVLFYNPRRLVNRAFFVFVFGTALWSVSIALMFGTRNFFWNQFVFYGGVLMFSGLLLFARVFPSTLTLPRRFYLVFLPMAAVVAGIPLDFYVKDFLVHESGRIEAVNGLGMPFFAVVVTAFVAASIVFLIHNYRRANAQHKNQMRYVFLGIALFMGSVILFDTILPTLGIHRFNVLGPLSSVFFFGLSAYAIVRHHLLDVRIVIERGAIFAVLLVIIIGVYLALVGTIGLLFQKATDIAALYAAGVTTLIGIFGVPSLERSFRRITDRIFFKDAYDLAEALNSISEILNRNAKREHIVAKTTACLEKILRARRVLIISTSERGGGGGLTIGLVLDGRALGTLVVGEKKSGDPYTTEDRRFLSTVAYQLAVALEKARLLEESERHAEELEIKVKERTAEIRAMHEREQNMVCDISHGLQTPLAVVKGELGFLRRQMPENKKLAVFERSIDDVSIFIRKLLSLARLGADTSGMPEERVNLSTLCRELAEYFDVVTRDKNIRFTSSVEDNLVVTGSRDRLSECITNIVSNAVAYQKEEGERQITMVLEKRDGDAVLRIVDTGIGIPPKDLPHIFERFRRVSHSKIARARGTGLGLAIARAIVKAHGGVITAKSALGAGSTFTITLPLTTKNTKEKEAHPL